MNDEFEFDEDIIEFPQPTKLDLSSLPTPNGYCHNCCEAIEFGKLFCDRDCRHDYKKQHFRVHGRYPAL